MSSVAHPLNPFPASAMRQAAIASLIALQANGKTLGADRVAAVAGALGVSMRTVYRDIANGGYTRTERRRFRIEDEELTFLFATRRNRRAAYTLLKKNYWPQGQEPSYSQFTRAVKADVHAAELAAMKGGNRAARRYELALIMSYQWPYELVVIDGKQMSVFVQHPTKRDSSDPSKPLLVRPWVLWGKDAYTRVIPAAVTSADALNHHDLLDVLHAVLWGDPELSPCSGRPLALAWDRGTLNTADAITLAVSALAIPVQLSDAWQPHQNGLIESFNALAESDFAATDPFYTHPPVGIDGRPFLPDPQYAPTFAEFTQKLRDWVAAYNTTWLHSALHGRTPIQEWEATEEKPDAIPEEWQRFLRLDSRPRTVTSKGVRIGNDFFVCEELEPEMDKTVDVAVRHDGRTVDVFNTDTGDWIGTAVNQKQLTPHQRVGIIATGTRRRSKIGQLHHQAVSFHEAAARAQREQARSTRAQTAADDEAAVATARVGRHRGALNQRVELPQPPRRHKVTRHR